MSLGLLLVGAQVAGSPCVLGVVKRDGGEGWERWGTAWDRLPWCLLQSQPGKCRAAVRYILTYHRDGNSSGKAGD